MALVSRADCTHIAKIKIEKIAKYVYVSKFWIYFAKMLDESEET